MDLERSIPRAPILGKGPVFGLGLVAASVLVCELSGVGRLLGTSLSEALDSAGALLAFGSALFLLHRSRLDESGSHFWFGMSLLGIGLMGAFHAVVPHGPQAHLLHMMSLMVGAALMIPVVGGGCRVSRTLRHRLPNVLAVVLTVIGTAVLTSCRWLPNSGLYEPGPLYTSLMDAASGLVFVGAAIRLLRVSGRDRGVSRILAAVSLMVGLGGLSFLLAPSREDWWLWYLLRLGGHLMLLAFLYGSSLKEHDELSLAKGELELARESMHNAAYAIFWVKADGTVIDTNRTAAQLLDRDEENISGARLADFFAEPRSVWFQIWQRLVKQGAYKGDSTWRRKDGTAFPVRIVGNRVSHEGRFYGCFFASDLTESRLVEQQLNQNISRFRAITENTSDIIFVLGNSGVYTYVSPAASRFAGVHEKDLLGRRPGLYVNDEDRPRVLDALSRASGHPGRTVRVDNVRVRRPDGSWLCLEGAYTALPDVPGIEGTVLNYRDITERLEAGRALEESRRQLATLLGNLPGMAYRVRNDETKTVEFVSEGSTAISGYTPEEFCVDGGMCSRDVIHPEDYERVQRTIREAIDAEGRYELEYRFVTRDGSEKWVWEQGAVVRDPEGRVVAFEGFITDINARVEAERTIRALNRELELRVEERTQELEEAQEHLIASEKMAALGGLVAGLAHEVNTPLGIGLTAASHLNDQLKATRRRFASGGLRRSDLESLLDLGEESSSLVVANLSRASDLIGSFKRVSIDQTSDERRAFDLGQYVEQVIVSLRPQYRKRPLTVRSECPAGIEVDTAPGIVAQIVSNLVQNALLHAFARDQSGTIVVGAEVAGDDVVLTYGDDGAGMDEGTRRRVFDPFFTTKRGAGGSGLGMHIVYNLVTETLGGEISCTSEPGRGTSFRIRFPRRTPAPAPATEPVTTGGGA